MKAAPARGERASGRTSDLSRAQVGPYRHAPRRPGSAAKLRRSPGSRKLPGTGVVVVLADNAAGSPIICEEGRRRRGQASSSRRRRAEAAALGCSTGGGPSLRGVRQGRPGAPSPPRFQPRRSGGLAATRVRPGSRPNQSASWSQAGASGLTGTSGPNARSGLRNSARSICRYQPSAWSASTGSRSARCPVALTSPSHARSATC